MRSQIFHKFLIGKKWNTNPEKSRPGAKRVRGTVILVRPDGMRGASGGLRRFKNLKDWENFGMRLGLEFFLKHAVLPPRGAVDSIAPRTLPALKTRSLARQPRVPVWNVTGS